jgi:hypothetical protein
VYYSPFWGTTSLSTTSKILRKEVIAGRYLYEKMFYSVFFVPLFNLAFSIYSVADLHPRSGPNLFGQIRIRKFETESGA